MKDEQLAGAQPKPRSPAELDSLVDIFLARLAELDERFLTAFDPYADYSDFPGRLEVADDIDAIATNDKDLGRAIRNEITRRHPHPTRFIQDCVESFDVFLDADEESAIAESLDDSRPAVAAWAQAHGQHVGTRGRLPRAVSDAYRRAMVHETRVEAMSAFDALKAVRGSHR